jgi:hypothetical protein
VSDQENKAEAGLQYLRDLSAELSRLYAAVKADMSDASEEEIHEEMRARYVRHHNPALFRVGVQLTPEQETMIRSLVEQNKINEAQQMILNELGKEFTGRPE